MTTTLLGKGIFPETDDYSLGMLGMHMALPTPKAIVEGDLILNIGSRFDDRIIGQADKFGANAKIIHMDIDPSEMNKVITPDVQVIGDAKASLSMLNQKVERLRDSRVAEAPCLLQEDSPSVSQAGGLRMHGHELLSPERGKSDSLHGCRAAPDVGGSVL